jgi:hypothetical protein
MDAITIHLAITQTHKLKPFKPLYESTFQAVLIEMWRLLPTNPFRMVVVGTQVSVTRKYLQVFASICKESRNTGVNL